MSIVIMKLAENGEFYLYLYHITVSFLVFVTKYFIFLIMET